MKLMTDGPDPPTTEASNSSLCCTNNVWLQLRLEVQRFSTAHPYMLTSVNFNNLVQKYKEYFIYEITILLLITLRFPEIKMCEMAEELRRVIDLCIT
jgi:hypothetical protein